MASINEQQPVDLIACIWHNIKTSQAINFSSFPPIDSTLTLIRVWLNSHFPSHPHLPDALTTITLLDSIPSSAFLRRNNIDPDDVIRLTWSLVSTRPSSYELFFETLLAIRENNSSQAHTIRLIQLAWTLSPILTSTTTDSSTNSLHKPSVQPLMSLDLHPTRNENTSHQALAHPLPLMSLPSPTISSYSIKHNTSHPHRQYPPTTTHNRLSTRRAPYRLTSRPISNIHHQHHPAEHQPAPSTHLPCMAASPTTQLNSSGYPAHNSPSFELPSSFNTEMIELS
ncbi:unnamed protein product [Rotaria magnacalcarata]|uniref:Uncharacterized protein n=1 Tax=Rotaria magnacalcarata TaxID=392030 RepID=A0A816YF49_9BILA|nr:unnamed protein product [Rotaria magnacalcarata]